jgi:hypothetical protein
MRKKLLTKSVLVQIPRWISESGLRPAEIAERIGCTVGTLRVWCSHNGISLRQLPRSREAPTAELTRNAGLILSVSEETHVRLQARAALLGLSGEELVKVLIETIDKDDLYGAVLDDLGGSRRS